MRRASNTCGTSPCILHTDARVRTKLALHCGHAHGSGPLRHTHLRCCCRSRSRRRQIAAARTRIPGCRARPPTPVRAATTGTEVSGGASTEVSIDPDSVVIHNALTESACCAVTSSTSVVTVTMTSPSDCKDRCSCSPMPPASLPSCSGPTSEQTTRTRTRSGDTPICDAYAVRNASTSKGTGHDCRGKKIVNVDCTFCSAAHTRDATAWLQTRRAAMLALYTRPLTLAATGSSSGAPAESTPHAAVTIVDARRCSQRGVVAVDQANRGASARVTRVADTVEVAIPLVGIAVARAIVAAHTSHSPSEHCTPIRYGRFQRRTTRPQRRPHRDRSVTD